MSSSSADPGAEPPGSGWQPTADQAAADEMLTSPGPPVVQDIDSDGNVVAEQPLGPADLGNYPPAAPKPAWWPAAGESFPDADDIDMTGSP